MLFAADKAISHLTNFVLQLDLLLSFSGLSARLSDATAQSVDKMMKLSFSQARFLYLFHRTGLTNVGSSIKLTSMFFGARFVSGA